MNSNRIASILHRSALVASGLLLTACGTSIHISGVAATSAQLSALVIASPAPTATPDPLASPTPTPDPSATPAPTPTPGPIACSFYDLHDQLSGLGIATLPDFSGLTALGTFYVDQFNVAPVSATQAFPGLPAALAPYTQNFGISCAAELHVDTGGYYTLGANSSEGVRVVVDGITQISDETAHSTRMSYRGVPLSAGPHSLRVDYFHAQGPEYALQLFWYRGEGLNLSVIPASAYVPAN